MKVAGCMALLGYAIKFPDIKYIKFNSHLTNSNNNLIVNQANLIQS